jgi:hypothetical protein
LRIEDPPQHLRADADRRSGTAGDDAIAKANSVRPFEAHGENVGATKSHDFPGERLSG